MKFNLWITITVLIIFQTNYAYSVATVFNSSPQLKIQYSSDDCKILVDSFQNVYNNEIKQLIRQYRELLKNNEKIKADSIIHEADLIYIHFKKRFSHTCNTTDINYLETFYYPYAAFSFYIHPDERTKLFDEMKGLVDACEMAHHESSFLFMTNMKAIYHLRMNEYQEMKVLLERGLKIGENNIEQHLERFFLLRNNYIIYLMFMNLREEALEVALKTDSMADKYGIPNMLHYIKNLCFLAESYISLDMPEALNKTLERLKYHCESDASVTNNENCILEEFYFIAAVKNKDFAMADSILNSGFKERVSPVSYDIKMNIVRLYTALSRYDEAASVIQDLKSTFDTYKVQDIHQYRLNLLKLQLDLERRKNDAEANTQMLKEIEYAFLANIYNVYNESPHQQFGILKPMRTLAWNLLEQFGDSDNAEAKAIIYALNTNIKKLTPIFLKKRNKIMANVENNSEILENEALRAELSAKFAKAQKSPVFDQSYKQQLMDSVLLIEKSLHSAIARNLKYTIPNISVELIQNQLSPNQLFIEYIQGSTVDNLYMVIISSQSFDIKKIENHTLTIDEKKNFINDSEYNKRWYAYFFEPIQKLIDQSNEIFIVSDGIVNKCPIEILSPDGTRKNSLINRISFRYFNNSKSFVERHNEDQYDIRILALGGIRYECNSNPDEVNEYANSRRNNIPQVYLPGTLTEVQNIHNRYPVSSELLSGCDATKDRLIKEMNDTVFSVFHISTHGILYLDSIISDKEYLYLKSGNAAFLALANGSHGYFSAYEITNQYLQRAKLVYLSACASGIGAQMAGNGLFSIGDAFYAAGADKVLFSLWDISDDFAILFADKFYESLQQGHTITTAFGKTQKYFSAKYPPILWAAFRLME